MVTRKHFVEIARIVATIDDNRTRWRVTSEMVTLLRTVNPKFDSEKFRAACNPKEGDQ